MTLHSFFNRRTLGLVAGGLLAAGLLLGAPGCQRWGHHGADAAGADVGYELRVAFDKPAYRPGEAVRASVELVDHTGRTHPVRDLNAQSVRFFFGRQGHPEQMEREAVASRREPMAGVAELPPGQPLRRDFLLTRLTQFGGPLVAQAQYSASPATKGGATTATAAKDAPPLKLYSNVVKYEVKGEPLFMRDPDGLLSKDDAIRLAQAAAALPAATSTSTTGTTPRAGEAVLIEDEAGFLRWWVNLPPAAENGRVRSYFIDPYAGRVWRQAREPFDAALARDPRSGRPANMPRQPVNVNALMNQSAGDNNPAAPSSDSAAPSSDSAAPVSDSAAPVNDNNSAAPAQ